MLDDPKRDVQSLISVMRRTQIKINESAQRVIAASRQAEKSFSHSLVLKRIESEIKKQLAEDKSLYYTS